MKMKNQVKTKTPLKFYPRAYEDLCSIKKWTMARKFVGAVDGSLDELIVKFRGFYKEADHSIFDIVVKEVWLEHQLTFKGARRTRRRSNGFFMDSAFGSFTKVGVGVTQRVITSFACFPRVASYLIDFFPEFLFDDPFKNPEKYQFPYKNISLGHMVFVYQMDNRLELLEEAEEKSMSYAEFVNWAYNWALCYSRDVEIDKYVMTGGHLFWPYIKNKKLKKSWENKKNNFNVRK